MNKDKFLVLAITVFFWTAMTSMFCSHSIKVVPEISRALFDQDVLDLTGKDIASTLFSHERELIIVATDGKISRWNPDEKIVNDIYNLNKPVDLSVTPLHQGNALMLKIMTPSTGANAAKTGYVVFDLKEMKETAFMKDKHAEKLLGLDKELVVYTTPTQQAIIFNFHTGTQVLVIEPTSSPLTEKTPVAPNPAATDKTEKNSHFLSCDFNGDEILLLSKNNLYRYSRSAKKLATFPLRYPASSGFLKMENSIYYGSQGRELIKLSIQSNKVVWHLQLANTLLLPPVPLGRYIVVTPEDNNIYFFNKNGTLYWWEQLNSTKRPQILTMKENAVVFLMDNRIKFFNYPKKQVNTYTLPAWMAIKSNPIHLDQYIYLVTQDKTEEKLDEKLEVGKDSEENKTPAYKRISKIGNNYTVEINMQPDFIWPKGKSIKIDLTGINFIEPEYTIQIFKNTTGQTADSMTRPPVFSRSFSKKDKPSFVWIPEDVAEYHMLITVEAENMKGVTIEKAIETIDINKKLRDYYYELQRQNTTTSPTTATVPKKSSETK